MKNIIVILTVLLSTAAMSQDVPSIKIVGEIPYNIEKIKNYVIHIQLKDVKSDGYSNFETKTLDEVKAEYKNKLTSIGVDFNKFSEDRNQFIYSGYSDNYNESAYFKYISNSETETINIIKTKIPGSMIQNVEINTEHFSSEKIGELSALAIKNAKEKAEKVAKNLNKKLGEIISINDRNYSTPTYTYYGVENLRYVVEVKFELL